MCFLIEGETKVLIQGVQTRDTVIIWPKFPKQIYIHKIYLWRKFILVECPDQPKSWHPHFKSNVRPSSKIRRADHPQWSSSRSLRSTPHSRKGLKFWLLWGQPRFFPTPKSFESAYKDFQIISKSSCEEGKT